MSSFLNVSPKVQELTRVLTDFVQKECIPAEKIYHSQLKQGADRWLHVPPIIEALKSRAKQLGLWNLFLPNYYKESPGLSNLEYAILCEILGTSYLAPEVLALT